MCAPNTTFYTAKKVQLNTDEYVTITYKDGRVITGNTFKGKELTLGNEVVCIQLNEEHEAPDCREMRFKETTRTLEELQSDSNAIGVVPYHLKPMNMNEFIEVHIVQHVCPPNRGN